MKRFSDRELAAGITNGNEETLVYLSRKYFRLARRFLRMRGFRDDQTPEIFSVVMARVFMTVRLQKPEHLEFEKYFLNELKEEAAKRKSEKRNGQPPSAGAFNSAEIVARCFYVLDESLQQLLLARVVENLNYEKIAARFQFSNAVIAQYETGKAFTQLEGIVRLRLNYFPN